MSPRRTLLVGAAAAAAALGLVGVLVVQGRGDATDLVLLIVVMAAAALLWRQGRRAARSASAATTTTVTSAVVPLERRVKAVDAHVTALGRDLAELRGRPVLTAEQVSAAVDVGGLSAVVANLDSHAVSLQQHLDAVTSALYDIDVVLREVRSREPDLRDGATGAGGPPHR